MPRPHQDPCEIAIHALAHATLAATSNGLPGTAHAAIEVQYLIASRIRPGLQARQIYASSYATLDYTVRGLEVQISSDLNTDRDFNCAKHHAECIKEIKSTIGKTFCLMKYAACLSEYFTTALGEQLKPVDHLRHRVNTRPRVSESGISPALPGRD